MPSMTRRFAPLPKLRVTRRSRAPERPQTSQVTTGRPEPDGDEDDLACAAELDRGAGLGTGEALALDEVLPLPRIRLALDRDDCARGDDVRGIGRAEPVLFEFFVRVPRDDLAA